MLTAGRAERDSGLRAWADEIELAAQGLLSGLSAQVEPSEKSTGVALSGFVAEVTNVPKSHSVWYAIGTTPTREGAGVVAKHGQKLADEYARLMAALDDTDSLDERDRISRRTDAITDELRAMGFGQLVRDINER